MLYVMLSVVAAGVLVLLGVKWAAMLDEKDAEIRRLSQEIVELTSQLNELARSKSYDAVELEKAQAQIQESYVNYMGDLVMVLHSADRESTLRALLKLRRK